MRLYGIQSPDPVALASFSSIIRPLNMFYAAKGVFVHLRMNDSGNTGGQNTHRFFCVFRITFTMQEKHIKRTILIPNKTKVDKF